MFGQIKNFLLSALILKVRSFDSIIKLAFVVKSY